MKNIFYEVNSLDKKCYDKFHLSEDILMEHASLAITKFIKKRFAKQSSVLIVCGSGNNGADGITLARLLYKDYDVCLYAPYELKSPMAKRQYERVKALGLTKSKKMLSCDVVIDCIFGTGLNKDLDEFSVKLIKELNSLNGYKIACDIPSGINKEGQIKQVAFKANTTITMGALKTSLFSDGGKDYIGKIKIASLGISSDLYENKSDIFLLEYKDMKLPFRNKKNSHKGDFGHLAVFVGDKKGAGILACDAAFNFGCSLVTAINDENIVLPHHIMHSNTIAQNTTALALGMGLGNKIDIKKILTLKLPKVVDADLFYNENILLALNEYSVLTPHPKEFCSLLKLCNLVNISVKELQENRFKYALKFSQKFPKTVLYLKGANSIIAYNKKLYINSLGNQVLSKGGSGDVLSGLIASLLAQGYKLLDAAITSSLAHSMAANNYKNNNYSLTPQDLIKEIKKIQRNSKEK